jgi:hypothetical protein
MVSSEYWTTVETMPFTTGTQFLNSRKSRATSPCVLSTALISAAASQTAAEGDGNDISVLLASNRLQITADVDSAGLKKVEKMLAKYKEILKLQ